MSYASLLVHVEAESTSSDARVQLAAGLAARCKAALIGVAAGALQPPPVDAFGGVVIAGDAMEIDEQEIRGDFKTAEARFNALVAGSGVETFWRTGLDLPAEVLAREARAADLVVLGRDHARMEAGVYRAAFPGDVLMRAGRPVLVVPPGAESLSTDDVLVAWKDGREARRAVYDALPLLSLAARVHVVEVTAEDELQAAGKRVDDVAFFLERHGVKVQAAEARTRRETSDTDELILVAEQHKAEVIVAGAYGKSRLREWAFGGVTSDLLRRSPKCCLLSH